MNSIKAIGGIGPGAGKGARAVLTARAEAAARRKRARVSRIARSEADRPGIVDEALDRRDIY